MQGLDWKTKVDKNLKYNSYQADILSKLQEREGDSRLWKHKTQSKSKGPPSYKEINENRFKIHRLYKFWFL